jgi:molecular chaperone GrpE
MSNETPDSQSEAAEDEMTEEMSPEAALFAEISRLEAENADLRDRVLRAAAEMDNLRKRSEREIADSRTYSIAGFARDMLTATDSLERALMALPAEARENADKSMTSLIEGIEMTEREMQRLLAKHGIVPIEANGVKFDPHKHQAMFDVPDPSVPEGTVVQVMQSGYAIGERILRPAMVGVAKGGPKPGAPQSVNETDGTDRDGPRLDKEV